MCWWRKKPEQEIVTMKPEIVGSITASEVEAILLAKHPEVEFLGISDTIFPLCSKQSLVDFLKLDETNTIVYVPEKMDCDDFAARLYGQMNDPAWAQFPFGLIWTNIHAIDFVIVDETKDFYYVEPQTDKLSQQLEGWEGLQARFIIT